MKNVRRSSARTSRSAFDAALLAGALLAGLTLSGCGSDGAEESVSGLNEDDWVGHPDPAIGSEFFQVEANKGGNASAVKIVNTSWGRLANVYDARGRFMEDLVIGEDIRNGGSFNFQIGAGAGSTIVSGLYELSVNPATSEFRVTLMNNTGQAPLDLAQLALDNDVEEAEVVALVLDPMTANLIPIQPRGLDETTTVSMVPRNAAIVIQFDDLVDPATVTMETVKLRVGYPPTDVFFPRTFPDKNHGDVLTVGGAQTFRSTRVVLDTAVSEFESSQTSPPISANALGLPSSVTAAQPNVVIRIPTETDSVSGQLEVLRNPSGSTVSFGNSNWPNDGQSSTEDVLTAMRSGGQSDITGDMNNGFLLDEIDPDVVGSQAVLITADAPDNSVDAQPEDRLVTVRFAFSNCAYALSEGSVVQQGNVFGQVLEDSPPPVGDTITDVLVRMFEPGVNYTIGLQGTAVSVFDPVANISTAPCFVRFTESNIGPNGQAGSLVTPESALVVRFSEPMDPESVAPFDTLFLTRSSEPAGADDMWEPSQFIVGRIERTPDLRSFTFSPTLPFTHQAGATESYFLNLLGGSDGPTDLAGNTLAAALPQIQFTLDPAEAAQDTDGFALRFSTPNEIVTGSMSDGPEIRGQFLYDIGRGVIRPRPVTRSSAVADRTQAVPANMIPFPSGLQTPLSPLGSKLQTLWRYCDVGFGLTDESTYNVDVEGLAWSPASGAALFDTYETFEIALAHSFRLPDEDINTVSLFPKHPNSGLVKTYASNLLDPANDPQKVVHPRSRGYIVSPVDAFQSTTGTQMMPFPLNRGLPVSEHEYYTWRDTSLLAVGGPNNAGAELDIVNTINGVPMPPPPVYPSGQVPSVGLPLLMEYRCFPDELALGLNAFDVSLAVNSSARPNFRAFSTGGVDTGGNTVTKNPDTQNEATGGFNPVGPPPGAMTQGVDNTFYIGQMDLVTRISRAHTLWFDTTSALPVFATPEVEPRATDQPGGTSIVLAFRGSLNASGDVIQNALTGIDPYGNAASGNVVFAGGDSWKSTITSLNGLGARYFQVRMTFVSNAETGLTAELSSIGFAYNL